jgi:hypothetical protein
MGEESFDWVGWRSRSAASSARSQLRITETIFGFPCAARNGYDGGEKRLGETSSAYATTSSR